MSVPPNLVASANGNDLYDPEFSELGSSKKAKLISKMRPQWPVSSGKPKEFQPPPPPTARKVSLKELTEICRERVNAYNHLAEDGKALYLTKLASQVFGVSSDTLAPHEHGVSNLNETILTMAEFILRLNKPILAKHGFRENLASLMEVDQLILNELPSEKAIAEEHPSVGEHWGLVDGLAQHYHQLGFGWSGDLQEMQPADVRSVKYTAHLIWMGLLAATTPIMTIYTSYMQHLALRPLERRLRSYSRTIALSELLLGVSLQLNRQRRAARKAEEGKGPDKYKHGRVIWILMCEDYDIAQLARDGIFEESAALKPEFEKTTIFLFTSDSTPNGFSGSWPCGKTVQVHTISDHANMVDVPEPEIIYMFNFNPDASGSLMHLLWVCSWQTDLDWRAFLLVTCRCEVEARKTKEVFDILGLESAWPYQTTPMRTRRDHIFVRNLFSGMASNPDIEYDDNGWMAAVYKTARPAQEITNLMTDPQLFFGLVARRHEFSQKRFKWTEQWRVGCIGRDPVILLRCGDPQPGDEFTAEHLAICQDHFESWITTAGELHDRGLIDVLEPEEPSPEGSGDEGKAQEALTEQAAEAPPAEGKEEEYRVLHTRVVVRSQPSVKSSPIGMYLLDATITGVATEVDGVKWLRIQHQRPKEKTKTEGFMLIDGEQLGFGRLLERVPSEKEVKRKGAKEAAEAEDRDEPAKQERTNRSPAVFWGILDLKYDSRKRMEDLVKVLETGDGRLSRFSGYGASIKESFQQDHKLEETIRRAVLTENKKLTHDVICEHGYTHLRPRQKEFRREYTPELADSVKTALYLSNDDICVLKLCNRARGAGVIPVRVSELDQVLKELLTPPADMQAWFKKQPRDWYRTVTWGCFEEQVRHWWSNECPCFLVEECCLSMPTEKDERHFDGTMRVGFSLHREHRNKLPRGWVDSPEGPVRVTSAGQDGDTRPPKPWLDDRPYLDLFRLDTSILRVQWLGGYWKLPIEDMESQDLRGKIVSVAKQGTAPVSDADLHKVYASLGDMVALLFGPNDMSQNMIRSRYKTFPELGAFIIARLACSMRSCDKSKANQLMELARMYMDKEEGACKDMVTSYIHRNLGVAEAGQRNSQWASAAEHFKKSMQRLPTNANSRHLMGLHYLEQGEPHKAIETFQETLFLDPDFKAPYACLSLAFLRLGQYEKAAILSQAGLARHPYTPACHYNLGVSSFVLAYQQEQAIGGGYIATELRRRALEALESAREQHFRDQPWEEKDDAMIRKLKDVAEPLAWNERKLPQDGWKVMGWRP